ncbi:MAG: MFS transporter [Acidimicrobiia bacterium]|nr:MFS transporter [Actinomycetota bacterium]MBL6925676.1 MFS transporter [Acidimicrobiia bacterium]
MKPARRDRPARRSAAGFYGWQMVALASLVGVLTGPGQSIGVSVFRQHLSDGLRLSDSAIATAYLVGTLLSSTFQPRIGRWVDEVGVRRASTVFGAVFALTLAHMSLVRGAVWLAVGFFGIRLLGQGALSMTSTVSVMHWFERRRGFALGLKMTLTMGGISVVPVLLALAIDAWGWRMAWLAAAAVVALTAIPVSWFGYVNRPADLGQQPDGGLRPDEIEDRSTLPSVTRSMALRFPGFWILSAVTATNALFGTGLLFHQTNLLGEIGYSNAQAAAMFLPQAAGAVAGGLTFGWLADRRVRRSLPAVVALLLAATMFLGGTATTFPTILLYSVILGVTMGSGGAVQGSLLPALFGVGHIGSISGTLGLIGVLASAMGALMFSLGNTVFGSYRGASLWLSVLPLAVAVVAITLRRHFTVDNPS